MEKKINKFAILGERCTGTNYLEECMAKNFEIQYTGEYGNKHFFCYNNYAQNNSINTLFIGIVRNPIYWLNSFSKELYHVSNLNKKNLYSFLFEEFYSVEKRKEPNMFYGNKLLLNNNLNYTNEVLNIRDLNYLNGKKYKNIFELRKVKHHFLINEMPHKVPNYILINYEDLLYNFDITMKLIKDKFNLIQKLPKFEKVSKYKKSTSYQFVKQREITFSIETIKLIWKNLYVQQENSLGYFPFNNNYFFIEKYMVKNEINPKDTMEKNNEDIVETNIDLDMQITENNSEEQSVVNSNDKNYIQNDIKEELNTYEKTYINKEENIDEIILIKNKKNKIKSIKMLKTI